jgi:hypothetical protein
VGHPPAGTGGKVSGQYKFSVEFSRDGVKPSQGPDVSAGLVSANKPVLAGEIGVSKPGSVFHADGTVTPGDKTQPYADIKMGDKTIGTPNASSDGKVNVASVESTIPPTPMMIGEFPIVTPPVTVGIDISIDFKSLIDAIPSLFSDDPDSDGKSQLSDTSKKVFSPQNDYPSWQNVLLVKHDEGMAGF